MFQSLQDFAFLFFFDGRPESSEFAGMTLEDIVTCAIWFISPEMNVQADVKNQQDRLRKWDPWGKAVSTW